MAKANKPPKPPHGGGGTPPPNPIPAPTGLTASRIDSSTVQLTWNTVTNATTYWIYRDGAVAWIITDTHFVDVYATGPHTYAVAAVVNENLGTVSAAVSVTA